MTAWMRRDTFDLLIHPAKHLSIKPVKKVLLTREIALLQAVLRQQELQRVYAVGYLSIGDARSHSLQ